MQCSYIKTDGQRCGAHAAGGGPYCFRHDPERAEEAAEASRQGGRAGGIRTLPADTPDEPLETVADVTRLLGVTINQVRRGEIDVKTSNAVGYLAGIMVRAIEVTDMEKRLEALEVTAQPASRHTPYG